MPTSSNYFWPMTCLRKEQADITSSSPNLASLSVMLTHTINHRPLTDVMISLPPPQMHWQGAGSHGWHPMNVGLSCLRTRQWAFQGATAHRTASATPCHDCCMQKLEYLCW